MAHRARADDRAGNAGVGDRERHGEVGQGQARLLCERDEPLDGVEPGRRPDDARLAGFVRRLRTRSEEFSALWDSHHVAVRRTDVKRFLHPIVGLLELDCEVLLNPGHDQRLIVHTARPGSRSSERLELLRVVGLQDLSRG